MHCSMAWRRKPCTLTCAGVLVPRQATPESVQEPQHGATHQAPALPLPPLPLRTTMLKAAELTLSWLAPPFFFRSASCFLWRAMAVF